VKKAIRNLFALSLALAILTSASASLAAEPTLIAAFFVKGKVGLKWSMVDGVTEYKVYRKTASGDFELVATASEDRYFDENITPGTTYNYRIGVMQDGQEAFSKPKTVTIPGQTGEFKSPAWVGMRVAKGKILLNWDDVPGAMAYNVYRSTTPGSSYEVVGNTQAASHADKEGLEAGVTYYYVLSAMNQDFEETPYSEEMSIKFGESAEERQAALDAEAAMKLEAVTLTHLHDLDVGENNKPMNQPADVFADTGGQIYVTDALGARVHVYGTGGDYVSSFGQFKTPFTIYIDEDDHIYVADIGNYDIQVFNIAGGLVRRIAVKETGDVEPFRANGICRLDANRLIVSDTGNHRLLIIDMDGNILSVVGKRGGDGAEFAYPGEMAMSGSGELYLLDVINNRVQVLDGDGNFLRAFGKAGEGAGLFGRPASLTLDPGGRVWVSDGMSGLIQSFTPQGEVKSVLGSAQDEWHFVSPRGMHFVGDRLYLVDRLSNKVFVFALG